MSGGAPCPGCGVVLPEYDGPTHPYIGASAACWALYGELLAHEYAELGYPECHRLTVDAYAVQHPGSAGRARSSRSATHLSGLYLVLERGFDGPAATALKNGVLATKPRFRLAQPARARIGRSRCRTCSRSAADISHCDAVETWARSVWAVLGASPRDRGRLGREARRRRSSRY